MGVNKESRRRAVHACEKLDALTWDELLEVAGILGIGRRPKDDLLREIRRTSQGYFADSLNRFADRVEEMISRKGDDR